MQVMSQACGRMKPRKGLPDWTQWRRPFYTDFPTAARRYAWEQDASNKKDACFHD